MSKNKYLEAHPEWFDEKGRPTPEVLRALIDYNPETGSMTWKERGAEWFLASESGMACNSPDATAKLWNTRFSASSCGTVAKSKINNKKHIGASLFNARHSGLQIAFAIMENRWSSDRLSPLDGDETNLIYKNISTSKKTTSNRNRQSKFFAGSKTSMYAGVSFRKDAGNWAATLYVEGKRLHLGYHKTKKEAADAYDRAALKYFGDNALLNVAGYLDPEPERIPELKTAPEPEVDMAPSDADDF